MKSVVSFGGAWKGGSQPGILGCGSGADDEATRRLVEGHGQEDSLVVSSRGQRGEWPDGAAPTGKHVVLHGMSVYQVDHGKIVYQADYFDPRGS